MYWLHVQGANEADALSGLPNYVRNFTKDFVETW